MDPLPLNQVICGDCREVMAGFPVESIDLVVTSPPYWGLRDYSVEQTIWGGDPNCEHDWQEIKENAEGYSSKARWQHGVNGRGEETRALLRRDNPEYWTNNILKYAWCGKCSAWRGSLGLEPHPQMFVDHMVEVCQGVRRVLKPTGSLWLNLGDSYCNIGKWVKKASGFPEDKNMRSREGGSIQGYNVKGGIRSDGGWLQPKQLLGLPWRVAAALQDDGWILRNAVCWFKPNSMPSSVKDRLKSSYEFFFFLVKQGRYYFDLDAIRVPHKGKPSGNRERVMLPDPMQGGRRHYGRSIPWTPTKHDQAVDRADRSYEDSLQVKGYDPNGKNPGDMWSIPTRPFKGAHFAVFPNELIEPIVKAACPKNGAILDPFAGSGTALRVARRLGRRFIGIELNPEYAKICEQRVRSDSYSNPPKGVISLKEVLNETPDSS